jgi:hypothetical protein
MDFKTFIDKAWEDHAGDPHAVAQNLCQGAALVSDESQLVQLTGLAHHVYGEHLGQWLEGSAFLQSLTELAPYAADGDSGGAVRRSLASLALSQAEGHDAGLTGLSLSERIRVGAMAAANLAERDTPRALGLFQGALDQARESDIGASDPMNPALAATANNLACTLEEKKGRSQQERELMIAAAHAARLYWERAGTWLQTERAEYRLAMTWLQAGDAAKARDHARSCLALIEANDGPALERFFGWEAMGMAEREGGNAAGHSRALANASKAFAELGESDKAWCAATLAKLGA